MGGFSFTGCVGISGCFRGGACALSRLYATFRSRGADSPCLSLGGIWNL